MLFYVFLVGLFVPRNHLPQGSKKANPLRLTLELIKQAGGIAPHEFSNPAPDQCVWFGLELAYNTADKAAATCIHHGMLAILPN